MGSAIARRLLDCERAVRVYDIRPEAVAEAA
jgi:2-hydroxy-3-oxopropionate reductase